MTYKIGIFWKAKIQLRVYSKVSCVLHSACTGHSNPRICLLQVQHLQFNHLFSNQIGWNLEHIASPESQENVRVAWPKLQAQFIDQIPDAF